MKKKILLAAIMAATPITSQAIDYSVKGFASLVGGMTLDKEQHRPHVKYAGGKYDESFTFDAESRVGIQGSVQLTDGLSVTAQVVSRGAHNWHPELKWAYVGYQFNDNVQLKVGRLNSPFYMFSDYQDVGYALPWVSAPRNAYIVPGDAAEAVNLISSFTTDKFEHVIEVYAGMYDDSQSKYESTEFGFEGSTFGFSYTPTYNGWLTLRATYHEVDLDLYSNALDGLNAGLKAIPSPTPSIQKFIANTESKNQRASFSGLAVKAEFEKLTLIAELNQLEWHTSIFPHQKRGYISAIYQVNDVFTPYITLMKNSDSDGDIQVTGGPDDAALAAQFGESDTFGWAIGGRYELMDNMALKAEYLSQSSNITKSEQTGEDVADTFRVALDIIF